MRKARYVAIILAIFLIAGCSAFQKKVHEDPYTASYYAYLQAIKYYTKAAEEYNLHYSMADPATQARWKDKIDPLFINAKLLLDQWHTALQTSTGYGDKYEQWDVIKKQLVLTGLSFLQEE